MIDADALLEKAWDAENGFGWEKVVSIKDVADAPTIDAVPVVRCKDCKWYEIAQLKQDGTDDRRYKPSYCTLLRHSFKPDYFCADGQRRDDETAD